MPARVTETPSLTLVESLMRAIPPVEGAALVARIGERASIVAASGNIEVGSAPLTVDAIDALIAQVLPPEQLLLLQEVGTVQFDLAPTPAVDGEFMVVAASAAGDRWLEIRRTSVPAATTPALRQAASTTSEADAVAQALPRPPITEAVASAPSATDTESEPTITDGPGSVSNLAVGPWSEPPAASIAEAPGTDDDLAVPTNLGFLAKSDFARDTLTLDDGFGYDAAPDDPAVSDRPGAAEIPVADNSRNRTFSAALQLARRRPGVTLSGVLLGTVVLFAAGLVAGGRLRSTLRGDVAGPPSALRAPTPTAVAPTPRKAVVATPLPRPEASPDGAAAHPAEHPAPTPAATPTVPKRIVAPVVPVAPVERPEDHPRAHFAIQVAAVLERDQADRMLARLAGQGYAAYVVRGQGSSAAFYRVRVGGFADRTAAEAAAIRLEHDEWGKPWILKEDAPAGTKDSAAPAPVR